jgi:CarD family transcriptional regulator
VTYAAGDTVVHPRHGIATVAGIVTRDVGESSTTYLDLMFATSSLTVSVPMDAVEGVGIRDLPTKQEVSAILDVLAEPSEVPDTWAERTASTTERVRSTELTQASMVIRDLTRHAQRTGKRLTSSEHDVLKTCLHTVSAELSLVLEISQDEARTLILDTALAAAV